MTQFVWQSTSQKVPTSVEFYQYILSGQWSKFFGYGSGESIARDIKTDIGNKRVSPQKPKLTWDGTTTKSVPLKFRNNERGQLSQLGRDGSIDIIIVQT